MAFPDDSAGTIVKHHGIIHPLQQEKQHQSRQGHDETDVEWLHARMVDMLLISPRIGTNESIFRSLDTILLYEDASSQV